MMNTNWMAQNHKAFFELIAKSKDFVKVYNQDGFYSVQALNKVYPKLTLCYEQINFSDSHFDNYLKAIELQEASPYVIIQKDEASTFIEKKLKENGFRLIEEWTSMSISLESLPNETNGKLQIVKVENEAQLHDWLKVIELMLFNKVLKELEIFKQLTLNDNVNLWLGYLNNQPVCTALSFIHSSSVGLYMISTLKEFRGNGFGREITLKALYDAIDKGLMQSVLQATRLGINMYRKIGFIENGVFQIFWKVGKQYM